MLKYFYPDEYVKSIYHINYKRLRKMNINALLIDIDNTLVPHYEKHASEKLINHFRKLKKMGFKVTLLSNNNAKRVNTFNDSINLDFKTIPKARKPLRGKIQKGLGLMGAKNENTCIIGDQIFTDIWGGKKLGLYTILVRQVVKRDEFLVMFKRLPEKIVLKSYIKSKQKNTKD